MSEPSLSHLERDVETARAKLAGDLSTLRSPSTTAEFTETLKQEAVDAKDALVEKAKASVQSSIESLIEEAKARAAANPAAALAIGAGVAWRLIRHPPITSLLVGAGLLSLFRTQPAYAYGGTSRDYLSHAKTRLVEQASEAADLAKEKAAALTETVTDKVAKATNELTERVQDLADQAATAAHQMAGETKEHANEMWRDTKDALEQARHSADSIAPTAATRDQMLLGAAGVAVIAALGIACQRRMVEHAEAN
jgi:ElaB/YqjD/DUF883 family membrane-anchored ribosome-binding protein